MSNDKWLMFKNYMHNELGITKEDIRCWLGEAVQKEARKLVDNTFNDFDLKAEIEKAFKNKGYFESTTFSRETMAVVRDVLMQKLEIKLKD